MAQKITTTNELRDYFSKVMIRTDHHALGVSQVALAVIGGIIWRATEINVLERDGETKNVLWMKTLNSNFYFTYDHKLDEILVKQDNHKGRELRRFTNSTSLADVHLFFFDM